MAHEQGLSPLRPARAAGDELDGRWPVPYAAMFIIVVSVILWSVIIAVTSWVLG
jgi:hypothetical protein